MLDQEILEGFQEETKGLLEELTRVVEQLETPSKDFPTALMEEFSQKIDRVMGAAKTLAMMDAEATSLKQIGAIAEICKRLGYKASEVKRAYLVPYFAAFWADTLETIEELVDGVGQSVSSSGVSKGFASHLQKRLEWLNSKLVAPGAGAVVAVDANAAQVGTSEIDIDALLKDLI